MVDNNTKIQVENLGVSYGGKIALKNLSMQIPANEIFGIIGPAQSGKTTFLNCFIENSPGKHDGRSLPGGT